ncbi:hypothetical protein K474DRAFT_1750865, partial [Panus rudis PR-1116 ss-1]
MTSGTGSPGSSSVPPVENLCLAEQFSGPDVQTQPMNLPGLSLDSEYDPFADIFATGDGGICDADGRPIEISAGIEFGTSSIRLASQIREQIDTGMLDLSRTINMDNVDELFDDDLTLSSVAQRELLSENIEATLLGHADFEEGETGDARWLRLSDDHMKTILWVMKECGTPNVPAFSALRAKQTQLTKELGVWTSHHMSAMGHRFSANAPAETFRLDFANPFVRPHMEFYPEVSSCVSEFWQAGKLLNEDVLDRLQPMWADWTRAKHRHYYVKELARLENNQLVIPLMWYRKDGAIWADAYNVTQEGGVRGTSNTSSESEPCVDLLRVDSSTIVTIRATDLRHNVLDLQAQGLNIQFTQDSPDALKEMPHPLRKIAKGRAMFSVNMMVWSDDVSGNRSKQYNPHTNVYLANLSLPHRKLQQEYFVRFCSTSPHASSSEQMNAVVENIGENNWHETYDCELNEEVMFRIIPRLLPADNPQQSETCSHIGLKGNFFCRRCGVGGKNEVKESNEGYHALFSPGTPRTPQETVAAIEEQLRAACLGVQETVNTLQAQTGVKDKIAQHWISILVPKARELQAQRIRNTHTCDARLRNDHIPAEVKQTIRHELTESIQCELFAWLIQQPPASFNALPPSSPLRNTLRPGDHYNPLLGQRSLNVHRDTPGEILHTYLLGQDK